MEASPNIGDTGLETPQEETPQEEDSQLSSLATDDVQEAEHGESSAEPNTTTAAPSAATSVPEGGLASLRPTDAKREKDVGALPKMNNREEAFVWLDKEIKSDMELYRLVSS